MNFKFQISNRYSKRVLSILLLFLFFNVFSQQIFIENKNNYPLKIRYKNQAIRLKSGESIKISDKEIHYLNIEYGKDRSKDIPVFLSSNESLKIALENYNQLIKFKGDTDSLHSLIINQQHYILYKNVAKYQEIYFKKRNTKELINFSEIVLSNYFDKINTSIKLSPIDKENEIYKRMVKYVISDWIVSIYLCFTGGKTLDLQSKEIILYYYNKYIKKEIENYNCEYKIQYNIINDLAKWLNQIKIILPKYNIIENTEDDSTNQYLPENCQKYYFINNYSYFESIHNSKKEYYKKVLKEKFNE